MVWSNFEVFSSMLILLGLVFLYFIYFFMHLGFYTCYCWTRRANFEHKCLFWPNHLRIKLWFLLLLKISVFVFLDFMGCVDGGFIESKCIIYVSHSTYVRDRPSTSTFYRQQLLAYLEPKDDRNSHR